MSLVFWFQRGPVIVEGKGEWAAWIVVAWADDIITDQEAKSQAGTSGLVQGSPLVACFHQPGSTSHRLRPSPKRTSSSKSTQNMDL